MKYSLKNEYKNLVKEEFAVVKRESQNYKEEIYDIDLYKNGNIKSGKKIKIQSDKKELFEVFYLYCSDSGVKLLNFINDNQNINFRKNINSMKDEDIVKYLNKHFHSTLDWDPNKSKDKGRGEISLHLAFNSNLNVKEPDFVSHDNNRKFSVKSFITMEGQITGVRSSKNNKFITIYNDNKEIKSIFDNQNYNNIFSVKSDFIETSNKSYNPPDFEKTVRYFVIDKDFSDDDKINKLNKIKNQFLNQLKIDLTKDHDSECIIGINKKKQFFVINEDNAIEKLGIYRINGNEISYYYMGDHNRNTFSKVIDKLIKEVKSKNESNLKKVYKHLF